VNLHENCVQLPSCETLCNSYFMEDSKAGCCGDDGAKKERVYVVLSTHAFASPG
jgi:hypothetical protein